MLLGYRRLRDVARRDGRAQFTAISKFTFSRYRCTYRMDGSAMGAKAIALAAGKQFYTTGKPCKYGHNPKRRTCTGRCVECENVSSLLRAKTDAGKATRQRYRETETGLIKERARTAKYHKSDKGKAAHKKYRESEKGKAARARALARRKAKRG